METYFTADTHFNHKNIIKYCNRPFLDQQEMNVELIRRWNGAVGLADTVYFLGDFAFGKIDEARDIFDLLNGYKYLIVGNHDQSRIKKFPWCGVWGTKRLMIDKHIVIIHHYATEEWEDRERGSILLHGHSHGGAKKILNRFDVGVDCFDYTPVTLDEILESR